MAKTAGFLMYAKRSKPLAACVLILLLVVGLCPATSVFAASYPVSVSDVTVTTDYTVVDNYIMNDGVAYPATGSGTDPAGMYTMVSYGRAYYNCAWDTTASINWGDKIVQGNFLLNVSATAPSVNGFTYSSGVVEILPYEFDEGLYNKTHAIASPGSPGRAHVSFYKVCQRPNAGGYISFKVTHTFRASSVGISPYILTTVKPTVTVSYAAGTAAVQYRLWTDIIDPYGHLLYDPDTGWLPTMNTNLQTMVTNQITSNSWLNLIQGQMLVANGHLTNIKSNQVEQIGKQQTQINQLQQIVDYVNSTQAANVVDQANTNFVNNANQLESGQANLENAADASLAAVDTSKIGLIGTYSKSVNWWMRIINWLPTGTGALWDVVVFGFLIAFLLFILRLVR